eukprot:1195099-Prorocentrum_minimum.AAC.1
MGGARGGGGPEGVRRGSGGGPQGVHRGSTGGQEMHQLKRRRSRRQARAHTSGGDVAAGGDEE